MELVWILDGPDKGQWVSVRETWNTFRSRDKQVRYRKVPLVFDHMHPELGIVTGTTLDLEEAAVVCHFLAGALLDAMPNFELH